MSTVALIMAAGQGTRMRSALPKVLHPICGRPMVLWPVEAAKAAGIDITLVIVGPDSEVPALLPGDTKTVVQPEPRGTGDAALAATDSFRDTDTVLVLSGDTPLLTSTDIADLLEAHLAASAEATMVTAEFDDPTGYGRVVRSVGGEFERVAETKAAGDASEAELALREVNGGIYLFDGRLLKMALAKIKPDNAQGELYLPDAYQELHRSGHRTITHQLSDPASISGVNNRADLAVVQAACQRRILETHMLNGVTVVDPQSTLVDVDVEIGEDALIEPFTVIRSGTRIGPRATVGPSATLIDCEVGAGSAVLHSYLDSCQVLDDCRVGPFAYLRPDAVLHSGAKAGTFVEIKNSEIGAGTKVPHLSYIGDADVGAGSNIGAGNITANYDGFRKHRTVIGAGVRTGVDTSFVAPVHVGDEAYTGAGSVITEDVPAGALGIARSRQTNVEKFAERQSEKKSDNS